MLVCRITSTTRADAYRVIYARQKIINRTFEKNSLAFETIYSLFVMLARPFCGTVVGGPMQMVKGGGSKDERPKILIFRYIHKGKCAIVFRIELFWGGIKKLFPKQQSNLISVRLSVQ